MLLLLLLCFSVCFFFKQKTSYERLISDWSSDVCSSDLRGRRRGLSARLLDISSYDEAGAAAIEAITQAARNLPSDGWLARLGEGYPFGPIERMLAEEIGRASSRERVCQYVLVSVVAGSFKKTTN